MIGIKYGDWAIHSKQCVERTTTSARAALGADAFDAALAEGAALSLEQAVAEAREESPPGGKGDGAHD